MENPVSCLQFFMGQIEGIMGMGIAYLSGMEHPPAIDFLAE